MPLLGDAGLAGQTDTPIMNFPTKEPDMSEITNRLQEMLAANAASATPEDPEILKGENPGLENHPVFAALSPEARQTIARNAPAVVNPEMTPANGFSGRSPAGRLRNYRAMNNTKLLATYRQVLYEGDDAEALEALKAECISREIL